MRAVRILGIDPGTVTVGFGCLDAADTARSSSRAGATRAVAHRASNVVAVTATVGRALALVEAGVLQLGRSGTPIEARLARLAEGLAALLVRLAPDCVALECAFAGKSVQSALRIGEARGVVLAEVHRAGIAIEQLTPARIKRSVTGHGGANKAAVARMAQQLLGLREPLPTLDATDALAVAYACLEQRHSLRRAAGMQG